MNGVFLTLFLSNCGSLHYWQETGILHREMEPYLALLASGACNNVQIFSYAAKDRKLLQDLRRKDQRYSNVTLISPRFDVGKSSMMSFVWGIFGPISNRRKLSGSDAIKTNQISGSWSAIAAHLITGKPLIMRMGYLLSRRFAMNNHYCRHWIAKAVENIGFRLADIVLFTSKEAGQTLLDKGYAAKSVHLPSYVDTALFQPKETYDFNASIVTISRLTEQKNLSNLISACKLLGRRLLIFGTGPEETALRDQVANSQADVIFAGNVENCSLSEKLHDHSIFVLPSYHEGLPKSLMEAMASGLICAGSNIPGITDLIEDGITGYLINGHQPTDIATTLLRILRDRETSIGHAARNSIVQQFCLTKYVEQEANIYDGLR